MHLSICSVGISMFVWRFGESNFGTDRPIAVQRSVVPSYRPQTTTHGGKPFRTSHARLSSTNGLLLPPQERSNGSLKSPSHPMAPLGPAMYLLNKWVCPNRQSQMDARVLCSTQLIYAYVYRYSLFWSRSARCASMTTATLILIKLFIIIPQFGDFSAHTGALVIHITALITINRCFDAWEGSGGVGCWPAFRGDAVVSLKRTDNLQGPPPRHTLGCHFDHNSTIRLKTRRSLSYWGLYIFKMI